MSTRRNHSQLIEDLKRFTGSPIVFKVPLLNTRYTEGIQYLAQKTHSYWMITDTSLIAKKLMKKSHFVCIDFKRLAKEEQQRLGYEAEITYSDGNRSVFLTQPYEYTDFPLDYLRLYFIDSILLLPSEY